MAHPKLRRPELRLRRLRAPLWCLIAASLLATGSRADVLVETLAGTSAPGCVDGFAPSAQFDSPGGVAVRSDGVVFVADTMNHVIRRIDINGAVTTLAGSCANPGYADGTGGTALFAYPAGLALRADGTIVVADAQNNRIREVTPGGVVTTLAGNGSGSFVDGFGVAAGFYSPRGVFVAADDSVFVADTNNNAIRKIDGATTFVSTIAGGSGINGYSNGPISIATFRRPRAVVQRPDGTLLVTDPDNHAIRLIVPGGEVSTFVGAEPFGGNGAAGFVDGLGTLALLDYPVGLTMDASGQLLVTEWGNDAVRSVDGSGYTSTLVGTGAAGLVNGPGWTAQLDNPYHIAFTPGGDAVVADSSNHVLRSLQMLPRSYCTAGISASGCQAQLSASGSASASATSGFELQAAGVEGDKDGLFFFGTNGRQTNSWGNGSSYQCVVPPVVRGGLLAGAGTPGQCDGFLSQDLNALWCSTCPKPLKNPGPGAVVQAQLWYRDPFNTSNQTTGLSDALEFLVHP
jgi:hypothetical protein